MKNLLAALVVAVAIVPASQTKQSTYDAVTLSYQNHQNPVLEQFEKSRSVASSQGQSQMRVPYGTMPYVVAFDIAEQLKHSGYEVSIDRASKLFNVGW